MNHHPSWMGFSRHALAQAVAVVIVATAAAPSLAQNTTASVAGRVLGSDGKPVAGANVTIVHVESGSTSSVVTDAEGRYSARGLRAGGPFTITFSKGGVTDRREDVFLQLAETATIDGQIGAPSGGVATITVTGRGGSDRFNRSSMGAGTSVGQRELQTLASISGNLQDFARTDPRLAQTDKERGEISAAGQNTRYNSITIDGVTTNDTFGLEANNLPTLRQPISINAIQSVQVNLSNYDVTQKGYTGANINAVTKSGTNEFKGSVSYAWRNDQYTGYRYNRTNDTFSPTPRFKDYATGITLGGPIIKDKLFFFASYEEFKSSRNSPAFGPLGSPLTNVGITTDAIAQAQATAQGTWGMAIGDSAIPQGLQLVVKDTLLKLDWNISDDHRANLRYAKTEQDDPVIAGFSTTGLALSSYWWSQKKTIETLVGQWFADWGPNFSTELKASQRDYDSEPQNNARLPAIALRYSGALPPGSPAGVSANNRFLNFGTENSRHFNVLRTKTADAYAAGTLVLGGHEIKFGLDYAKNEIFNAFLQNVFGNYTFGCEPGTYSFGTIADCNAATVTSAQRDLATLENFRRGLPSSYTLQTALAGRTINDAVAVWEYENQGLFLQDSWTVAPSFNLMFGVRLDQLKVPTRPIANTAAAAQRVPGRVTDATGAAGANSVVRDTGGFGLDNTVTLDNSELVQPRLGFNWNLGTPERRMQLRGGFGLFQGAAANVWLSNPFSNTGAAVTTFSCTTFQACNGSSLSTATLPALFSANPDTQRQPSGTPPAPNVDFISRDLEQPSVWKANLAFEMELPQLPVVGRLIASAEWLHTDVKSGIYYKHLNLGAPTRTGTDGRELYWMPQSYSQNCWSGSNLLTTGACSGGRDRALSNAGFGRNILLADRTSKGNGDAVTLSISQPVRDGFSWSAAYTYTRAKEVSPLTSSTSGSNWGNRNIFNPNEEVLQNSNYVTKDRVSASVGWTKAFVGNYRTSFGVFYEGRRGKPYSWTYINDLNGDGQGGNDLMYIPTAPGSGEVVFRGGATEEARFWDIVNGNEGLAKYKGRVVGRNDSYAPWVNNFDVRVSQELPGFTRKHKASVTLDILNFANLLNRNWGRIDEIGFPSNRSFVNFNGLDSQGRYVYSLGTLEDLSTRQTSGESQWAMQITLRYEF
jgi:hypothetical protein